MEAQSSSSSVDSASPAAHQKGSEGPPLKKHSHFSHLTAFINKGEIALHVCLYFKLAHNLTG